MNIRKVYKKENFSGNSETDMVIVDNKYFCKIQNSRVTHSGRIHWTTANTAVDIEGTKYTFADSCYMIGPMIPREHMRTVIEDNFECIIPGNIPKIWTTTELSFKEHHIEFTRPLYSLCAGTWITFNGTRTMVLETILKDDSVITEIEGHTILVLGASFSIIDNRINTKK